MGKLVPRDSFDIRQGCANSGPGRLGVPEVVQTDGPGFSLCAAPLELSGPVFRSDTVRTAEGDGSPEYLRLERDRENLVCERGQDLVGNLVNT